MEETLNLEEILDVLKKNILMIISLALLAGAIAAFATAFLMTPQYRATTQVLVSQSEQTESFTQQDIQASLQVINTYSDIITSPAILEPVAENLELDYSSAELASQVTVNNENDSQVLNISVENEVAENAETLANEIATVFQENIADIMNVDNVSILTAADVGDEPSPVSPQPLVNIAIGLILGGLLGLGIAFLRAFLDTSLQSEEDVQKYLDLPVVGTVSKFDK